MLESKYTFLSYMVWSLVWSIIIKSGPARRVDPEPCRPDGWTGLGEAKDRDGKKLDKTCRVDPSDSAKPGLFFFFLQM
jgi:hypothetical protein